MTGSDAVVQSLINEGIDLVFGIQGYHSQHLYGRLMQQDKIRHVLFGTSKARATWLSAWLG
jgi:acetolactate synthase-1/2/3 large subunit